LDCVNGAGSVIYPQLLESLGCEVYTIHCDSSGLFPHSPEPLPENLKDLCQLVQSEACAVGFAVDPDGDRLAVVDENAQPIGEEMTLAFAVQTVLKRTPGPVVINSLTTQTIDDIARSFGVECHRTRVGEANVSARMLEVNAVVGGEGNGGVIFPELHMVRDAGVGMALLVNRLAGTRKSVSALIREMPAYHLLKSSLPIGYHDSGEIIDEVSRNFSHDQVSRIDGLKVFHSDGWVQVRSSNTEPILRVFAEAAASERAQELLNDMLGSINQAMTRSARAQ